MIGHLTWMRWLYPTIPRHILPPDMHRHICCGAVLEDVNESLRPEAMEMVEQFSAERHQAQEALVLGQHFQKRAYNKGRLALEFSVGDSVLLNLHSLSLLRN